MGKILIEQSEWDEVRALATNIIVHGGEARRFGTGKHARWALSFGLRPGSASGSTYSGPFAVIDSSADGTVQVTVCGTNSIEGRNFTSQIILGLTVKTFAEANLSISASGYVYLKITYSSSDYIIELKTAAALPAQTATEYYVPLAWVDYASSAISGITQLQFGQIQAAGRIV